jgi:hypothetical protein
MCKEPRVVSAVLTRPEGFTTGKTVHLVKSSAQVTPSPILFCSFLSLINKFGVMILAMG